MLASCFIAESIDTPLKSGNDKPFRVAYNLRITPFCVCRAVFFSAVSLGARCDSANPQAAC